MSAPVNAPLRLAPDLVHGIAILAGDTVDLGTHVADAETADAAHRAAIKAAAPDTRRTQMVGGRLTTYYGSEAALVSHSLRD